MNGNKFYHLRFVRDLDDSQKFLEQKKLSEYLLLDYFDFLILEQAESFEECALGKEKFSCEAEQGLGIFSLGDTADRFPFLESSSDRPFLGIIQLTINPFFYKACSSPDGISKLKSDIEQEIKNASAKDNDVIYQIYQTVNAADFCIIVISKKIKFLEHLSKLLKKKSFVYRGKKYLTFSIYENTGIHKDVTESQLQEAFEQKHALIARIRVKDHYWNGLKKENWSLDSENCKPSMLSGRYHFSIRIEGAEIASTLKNIIDFKFNAVTPPTDNIHNVLQQIMSENKIAYINERILFHDEMECRNESEINKEHAAVESPQYKGEIRRFEEIRERLKNKTDPQTLETYLEKIQSLYYMQIKLVRYADTHISVIMFREYYEAFLEGFLLEVENIQDDMMDDLLYHLKIGLRYLYQFADIIYSINATTFQAPKYDIVPNMSASPKLAIAYTEYLRDIINDYRCMRNAQDNDDEKQFFPNYIPMIIPEITEEYADFSMLITFPQGFIDDWTMESENWAKYIKGGKKTPLYVICQKFRMFTNISDVLTLSFHELGHYANYLPCVWCLFPQDMNRYTVKEVLLSNPDKISLLITKSEKKFQNSGGIFELGTFLQRAKKNWKDYQYVFFESREMEDMHLNYLYNLAHFEEMLASVEKNPAAAYEGGLVNPLHYILDKIYGTGIGIKELRPLPLAIIHPYHSDRIRAQQGTFTIFPDYITEERENFSEIADMRYMSGTEERLHRLILRYPDRIAKELMSIGAHRSWLYPEEPIVSQEIESGL